MFIRVIKDMKYEISVAELAKQRGDCLIVAIYEANKLSPAAKKLDALTNGAVKEAVKSGDITGKTGSTLLLRNLDGIKNKRVLLVGAGKENECKERDYRKILTSAVVAVRNTGAKTAASFLNQIAIPECDGHWQTRQLIAAVASEEFEAGKLKSDKEKTSKPLNKITIVTDAEEKEIVKLAIAEGAAIANGMELTKELANAPGNHCTPTTLANEARKLAKKFTKIKTTVLDEKKMASLGMGSLLSVSRGSKEPAKLITMEYQGAAKSVKPIVLVGKGLTFDSGGISLKPPASMDEMKYDMSGAASVFGTIQAVAELGLKINVVGVIPSSENMPGSQANKPGDIVTSMSGQTIEILNTDAEGRLILCDALTYSAKFKPELIIDIATLTGACVIALGAHASGLLGNDDDLAEELFMASDYTGDKVWQLPVWDEYDEQLKSNFADMANIGGREAGTITAACFLSRFVKEQRWAHIDIAGTAWVSGKNKGATGRPVPLLTQFLLDKSAG